MRHLLQYPVYFAFENDEMDAVLAEVKKNDATGQPATATTGGLVDYLLVKFPVDCYYRPLIPVSLLRKFKDFV